MVRAYYYEDGGDQRMENKGPDVPIEELHRIGVLTWELNGDDAMEEVDRIAQERSYKNRDQITVSKAAMGDIYEAKVKSFFDEHLHEDEEIRYILDGEGYFDIRNKDDRWIRLAMRKGDLAVLPAGVYHRFTTSMSDYIKAMRLFKEEPKWTPINRGESTDRNVYRQEYVRSIS